jgi:heptosyltransferase-2
LYFPKSKTDFSEKIRGEMNFFTTLLLKSFSRSKKKSGWRLTEIKRVLIIWQHNQLGDLIVSYPLYRAIKENFPGVSLTVILSPANYRGLETCQYIDKLFVFDKRNLKSFSYLKELKSILRNNYDVVIVPSVVSISFTSNFLAGLSKAKFKIGPNSLNGIANESNFFFDKRVDLDWRNTPDKHVAERTLDILKPLGLTTSELHPQISYSKVEYNDIQNFINSIPGNKSTKIIGFHIGAGKPQNRWHYNNFSELINLLCAKNNYRIYFTTGGKEDFELIKLVQQKLNVQTAIFDQRGISKLYALIEHSDLFITNDTGPMHVAAASSRPVISLFGSTNPHMWRPLKENKKFIRVSDNINDIKVEAVLELSKSLLETDRT